MYYLRVWNKSSVELANGWGIMIQSRKWGKSIKRTVKAKLWKRCQLVKGSMVLNYPPPFALTLILFFVAKLPGISALFLHLYIFPPSLGSGCHQDVFEHASPLLGKEGLQDWNKSRGKAPAMADSAEVWGQNIKTVSVKVALQLPSSWATTFNYFVLLAEEFCQGFFFPPQPLVFPFLLPQGRKQKGVRREGHKSPQRHQANESQGWLSSCKCSWLSRWGKISPKLRIWFGAGVVALALDMQCAMLAEELCGVAVGNSWILGSGMH